VHPVLAGFNWAITAAIGLKMLDCPVSIGEWANGLMAGAFMHAGDPNAPPPYVYKDTNRNSKPRQ
jgi:hypothetical protein